MNEQCHFKTGQNKNYCKAEGGSRLQLAALAEYNPAVAPIAPVAALLPHPAPLDHIRRRPISETSQKVNVENTKHAIARFLDSNQHARCVGFKSQSFVLGASEMSLLPFYSLEMRLHLLDAVKPKQLRHKVTEPQFYLPFERLEQLEVLGARRCASAALVLHL